MLVVCLTKDCQTELQKTRGDRLERRKFTQMYSSFRKLISLIFAKTRATPPVNPSKLSSTFELLKEKFRTEKNCTF